LARYLQWASTAVVGAASTSASRLGGDDDGGPVPLPDLPPTELDPLEDPDPIKW